MEAYERFENRKLGSHIHLANHRLYMVLGDLPHKLKPATPLWHVTSLQCYIWYTSEPSNAPQNKPFPPGRASTRKVQKTEKACQMASESSGRHALQSNKSNAIVQKKKPAAPVQKKKLAAATAKNVATSNCSYAYLLQKDTLPDCVSSSTSDVPLPSSVACSLSILPPPPSANLLQYHCLSRLSLSSLMTWVYCLPHHPLSILIHKYLNGNNPLPHNHQSMPSPSPSPSLLPSTSRTAKAAHDFSTIEDVQLGSKLHAIK
ncbi:hypothetical protein BDQ17DRAFT_1335631 [Cyathus striatus]|nr:hypothetical protein BDQ17DRAFT_1335631 [Cyathus striatus]